MLNLKKTQTVSTGTLKEFILEGIKMEINCYTFLGSIITRDGYDCKEINRRLSIGRMANDKTGKKMFHIRKRLLSFHIRSTSLILTNHPTTRCLCGLVTVSCNYAGKT